jgi:hypothetical protein
VVRGIRDYGISKACETCAAMARCKLWRAREERVAAGARGGVGSGARERSSRNNPAYFGRAAPRAGTAAPAHRSAAPHYPLTIRNRPTSWMLDLGYNDLTSAK